MGQQQLLLVILGIIIVGIALTVGISQFRASSIDSKRDLLLNESSNLAVLAMSYYKKTTNFGGGGGSFSGWSIPGQLNKTASGSFYAAVYSDSVVITGVGNEVVTGTDSVKIQTVVLAKTFYSRTIN